MWKEGIDLIQLAISYALVDLYGIAVVCEMYHVLEDCSVVETVKSRRVKLLGKSRPIAGMTSGRDPGIDRDTHSAAIAPPGSE